jgi:hypothetical protein
MGTFTSLDSMIPFYNLLSVSLSRRQAYFCVDIWGICQSTGPAKHVDFSHLRHSLIGYPVVSGNRNTVRPPFLVARFLFAFRSLPGPLCVHRRNIVVGARHPAYHACQEVWHVV